MARVFRFSSNIAVFSLQINSKVVVLKRSYVSILTVSPFFPRCYLEDGASKGAWLNRSSIIFAGSDKWSVDPRVSIATANRREYSLQIQDVDVTDDGPYTCSVQTQHTPRTMQVHLTVQGKCLNQLQILTGDVLEKNSFIGGKCQLSTF